MGLRLGFGLGFGSEIGSGFTWTRCEVPAGKPDSTHIISRPRQASTWVGVGVGLGLG